MLPKILKPQNWPRFSQPIKNSGATLIELMAMLLVVSLALTILFYTLSQSIAFSRDAEARIKAVALAREGIEWMYNIRNTNWLRFSSDRKKCWITFNYKKECDILIQKKSYIIYQQNGLWKLGDPSSTDASGNPIGTSIDVNNFFGTIGNFSMGIDSEGWYLGSGGVTNLPAPEPGKYNYSEICKNIGNTTTTNCRSIFYREIKVEKFFDDAGNDVTNPQDATGMQVRSLVYWYNRWPKKVELVADITNWKSRYTE